MSEKQIPVRRSGRPSRGEPILQRAFRVLAAFAETGEGLTLHRLATRADLPVSTAWRIGAQLVELGVLERRGNGEYVVGLRLLEIATLAPRGHGLRAAALPFMQDLHHVTGQHILLAVREGHEAVLVERLSARNATAVKYRVGGRLPLADTGIGIALLAHAPDQVRQDTLACAANSGLVRRHIATIHRDGVCAMAAPNPVSAGPATISTVAAPILDRHGNLLGALSLVAPEERSPRPAARIAVRTASMAISRATTN